MLILERWEEDTAVIETDDGTINVLRNQLPPNAKEGDVLVSANGAYRIDEAATKARRERLLERTRRLRKPK